MTVELLTNFVLRDQGAAPESIDTSALSTELRGLGRRVAGRPTVVWAEDGRDSVAKTSRRLATYSCGRPQARSSLSGVVPTEYRLTERGRKLRALVTALARFAETA